jgi:4-amino-4-deoxy-L-arabinose transferase-like glycosyltransferase
MKQLRILKNFFTSDLGILILLAFARFLMHMLANGQYGFHRDELAMFDYARHLDWGFIDFPPLAPFVMRIGYELFGGSMAGVRLFGALAQSLATLLAGLMARELGGKRWAQIFAAVAVTISPWSLMLGSVLVYTTYDFLWWVLIAYLMIRLLKSENPRWWLGIGAVIGLGMQTKYSIVFIIAGVVAGVVLTRARRYLLSPWLWAGVLLAVLVFLPNLVWQAQHDFISLDFLSSIHARDIRDGRTDTFLKDQLYISANLATIPLWILGLGFYFFAPAGGRYRTLGWMFVVPFVLLYYTKGRGYYLAPAYPMLLAAGAVWLAQGVAHLSTWKARLVQGFSWTILAAGFIVFCSLAMPIAPVNSAWWKTVTDINSEFKEEIGWPELVKAVAKIYAALPAEEQAVTGILTGNYGEAGAINLYGPAYGLPEAISGVNSY